MAKRVLNGNETQSENEHTYNPTPNQTTINWAANDHPQKLKQKFQEKNTHTFMISKQTSCCLLFCGLHQNTEETTLFFGFSFSLLFVLWQTDRWLLHQRMCEWVSYLPIQCTSREHMLWLHPHQKAPHLHLWASSNYRLQMFPGSVSLHRAHIQKKTENKSFKMIFLSSTNAEIIFLLLAHHHHHHHAHLRVQCSPTSAHSKKPQEEEERLFQHHVLQSLQKIAEQKKERIPRASLSWSFCFRHSSSF